MPKLVQSNIVTPNVNISEADKKSNKKFSLSVDSEGKGLSEGQKEYFKDESPLLLDENGGLKRYYHGTARKDRVGTIFDPNRATSGPMAYFTDDVKIANNYAKDKARISILNLYPVIQMGNGLKQMLISPV